MPALLLGVVLLLVSIFAPAAQATCYCADPTAALCRCTASPPATATYEAEIGGVKVKCDSQVEVNSIFEIKAPICGSASETLPFCASDKQDPSRFFCYGRGFALGATDPLLGQASDHSWIDPVDGPFAYNGGQFGKSGETYKVYVCDAGVFCCGQSGCDNSAVPRGSACSPQDETVTPPAGICGVVGVRGGPGAPAKPGGQTDSRIYFPHVKNTSALTYLLQSLFRPISLGLENLKRQVIYSKVDLHQGISDSTEVVNRVDNNSSLIPGRPAPSPLFDFADPDRPVASDGTCTISDVRTNPGDDLLGQKVFANLDYTQKFTYELLPGVLEGTCGRTGEVRSAPEECCSKSGSPNHDRSRVVSYTCKSHPVSSPTKGRVLVYTKSPYLEYLYQNLVAGPMAVYRRFVSADTVTDIKDIPAGGTIKVSAIETSRGPSDLAQTPSQVYFPHLGSIYDYFLQGLQKLLRPAGLFGRFGQTLSPVGDCHTVAQNTPAAPACPVGSGLKLNSPCLINSALRQIIEEAGSAFGVPPDIIAGILSIETRNGVFSAPLDQKYLCEPNACGAMGAMQLLTGYGVQPSCSQAAGVDRWSQYACSTGGLNPNPGNIRDSIFAGAKMIKAVSETGRGENHNWDKDTVYKVAERYYGNCSATFPITSTLQSANKCLASFPNIPKNEELSYCEYLWLYYAPRDQGPSRPNVR